MLGAVQRWLTVGMILAAAQGAANAQLTAEDISSFPAGGGPFAFASLPARTEVNNLNFHGMTFHVLHNGIATNGLVKVNPGSGATNNVGARSATGGNDSGLTLLVSLASPVTDFGYGYTDLFTGSLADGTTIEPFTGATSLGPVVYAASPDPTNAGGFAGLHSAAPFDSVALSFSPSAFAFGVDNFRFSPDISPATPEPGAAPLLFASLLPVLIVAKRRRSRKS